MTRAEQLLRLQEYRRLMAEATTWAEQLRELRDKLQVIADRMEVNMGKKSGTDTAAWVADVREYRRLMAEATELIRSPWSRSEGGTGGVRRS